MGRCSCILTIDDMSLGGKQLLKIEDGSNGSWNVTMLPTSQHAERSLSLTAADWARVSAILDAFATVKAP